MVSLLTAAAATGVWAAFGSGAALTLNVVVDLVAIAYGVLVYRPGRLRPERVRQVRTSNRHAVAGPANPWPSSTANVDLDEPLFFEEQIAL